MRALLAALLLVSLPALAQYRVYFDGVPDQEIQETIVSVSELLSKIERPPPTYFTLKKRAEKDRERLLQIFHAYGFYEAQIEIEYLGQYPEVSIWMKITPGVQYLFGEVSIVDMEGEPLCLNPGVFAMQCGCPARSDKILDTEDSILTQLAKCGHPLAAVENREVIVDQKCKLVSVTFEVSVGPQANFGSVTLEGIRKVKPGFICKHIKWREGQIYDPIKVICTDLELQESGLFALVKINHAEEVDRWGYLPMTISVEEVKYRHVGAGVSYSTDESAGVMAQWSHDNLNGWGDSFSFVGEYSKVIKRGTLFYVLPDFCRMGQNLTLSAEARREDTPGFIEREVSLLARISRRVGRYFTYSFAGRYEWLLSTKSDNDENYHLFSIPLQARWDSSNRLLDPTSGTTIFYWATPYKALFDESVFFLKQELFAATYQAVTSGGFFILAGSAQFGSILGDARFEVPAPKRFYAGSSTGLRGYKYLSVSPLVGTKPIGGKSLMIFQFEPRMRIFGNLYVVGFYDIGNVYAQSWPQFNQKLLSSAGTGLRYLTPLGPFRLDIAFPLDKRKGIDKSFQIYASIGQSF